MLGMLNLGILFLRNFTIHKLYFYKKPIFCGIQSLWSIDLRVWNLKPIKKKDVKNFVKKSIPNAQQPYQHVSSQESQLFSMQSIRFNFHQSVHRRRCFWKITQEHIFIFQQMILNTTTTGLFKYSTCLPVRASFFINPRKIQWCTQALLIIFWLDI